LWAWHAQVHLLAALHMSDGAFAIADAAAAASHVPVVGVVCLCHRAGQQRHIDHTQHLAELRQVLAEFIDD
jgi:hypothetical protein